MLANISKTPDGIKFDIRVIPKSSRNELSLMEDGTIKVKINAPPVDGKANAACIKLFSGILNVSKSKIQIVTGLKSKTKQVEVTGNSDVLCKNLIDSLKSE